MGWKEIKDNAPKASDAQIEYAKRLLEERYGDIDCGLSDMTANQISELIDDLLYKPPEKVKIKHVYKPKPETERTWITPNMRSLFEGAFTPNINSVSALLAMQQAEERRRAYETSLIDALHREITAEDIQRMHETFQNILGTVPDGMATTSSTQTSTLTTEQIRHTMETMLTAEQRDLVPPPLYTAPLNSSDWGNIIRNIDPSTRGDEE